MALPHQRRIVEIRELAISISSKCCRESSGNWGPSILHTAIPLYGEEPSAESCESLIGGPIPANVPAVVGLQSLLLIEPPRLVSPAMHTLCVSPGRERGGCAIQEALPCPTLTRIVKYTSSSNGDTVGQILMSGSQQSSGIEPRGKPIRTPFLG